MALNPFTRPPFLLLLGLALPSLAEGQGPQFSAQAGAGLTHPNPAFSTKLLAVDVDGNGSRDLVVMAYGAAGAPQLTRAYIHLNDGHGRFPTLKWLPRGFADRIGAAGDFDGDGDIDLIADGLIGTTIKTWALFLLRNDGRGNYTVASGNPPHIAKPGTSITSMAVGDVDGDRDLDLVVGQYRGTGGGPTRLYLNNGKGRFTAAAAKSLPSGNPLHRSLLLVDVDLDKDLDIIIGDAGQMRLYLNDGRGRFSDVSARQVPKLTKGIVELIAVLDAEGDGDPDLVLSSSEGTLLLYLNAKGTFRDATSSHFPKPLANRYSVNLATGDVDADGDIDFLVSEWQAVRTASSVVLGPGQNRLFVNDGKGVFGDATSVRLAKKKDWSHEALLADLDQDGDPDLVLCDRSPMLLYNLHRHTYSGQDPMRGSTWKLDFYAQPGYATQSQAIIPILGASLLRRAVVVAPFGALALSPQFLLMLPGPTIARPGGRATIGMAVPNSPSLKGLRVHLQGLWLHGTPFSTWRLGNLVSGTIR